MQEKLENTISRSFAISTAELFCLEIMVEGQNFSIVLHSLVYKTFQGRNLSNFFGGILENREFSKYILTFSDFYQSILYCIL